MAHQNTGTYLLVREGGAPRPDLAERPIEPGLPPVAYPPPPARLRVRRRAVVLTPQQVDERLVVWLEPSHPASDRLYRAVAPMVEAGLGAVILVTGTTGGVGASTVAANLAGACCAWHRTVLVDLHAARPSQAARFGCPTDDTGVSVSLAARRQDPTAPIDVLGLARGLDLLAAGPATAADPLDSPALPGLLQDLAARAAIVLVDGPPLDELAWDAWAPLVTGAVVVGPPGPLAGVTAPVPFVAIATRCPPTA